MTAAAAFDPRIVAGADYGNPDPEWPPWIDWQPAPAPGRAARGARSTTSRSARASRSSSSTASPAAGRTGWRTCPTSARGHRAIALDLPGFGTSPMPSWEIDMPAYGRLLHDFCEKLGLERATLVGNSMGGFIAVEAVTATPGRFEPPGPGLGGRDHQHLEPGSSGRSPPPGPGSTFGGTVADRGALDRLPSARPRARLGARSSATRAGCARTCCSSRWRRRPLPRLRRRPARRDPPRHPRAPGRDRDADDDRLGPVGPGDPDGGGAQLPPPYPPLAPGDLRAHRPLPQLERPARFNALLDEFLAS